MSKMREFLNTLNETELEWVEKAVTTQPEVTRGLSEDGKIQAFIELICGEYKWRAEAEPPGGKGRELEKRKFILYGAWEKLGFVKG